MVELITDRTQYHVTLLNRLRKKPWSSMTASERMAWNGDAAKGAYNHVDLNRVETAVTEIAGILGLTLTTKTNWTLWDIPVKAEMERYLSNIVAIRDACPNVVGFPVLPTSMDRLTYEGANSIEKVLMLVYQSIAGNEHNCVLGEFVLGECTLGGDSHSPDVPSSPVDPSDSTIRSGDIYCGEVL